MARYEDEIHPVNRITTDAIGEKGARVFVLQASVDRRVMTWVIEKEQAVALGRGLPQLLADVETEFPELDEPTVAANPNLDIVTPREVEFRVGSIGLGYDRLHDLVVLTLMDVGVTEIMEEEDFEDDDEPPMTYIYTTRGQAVLLAQQAERAVASGRPYCPNCGEPIDEFGHFCMPPDHGRLVAGNYVL